ncbi:hypothetical protein [Neomegalonema sp.]|uniref:hypothetical protein n=1 Tax=Neomegalonema sp. TaxID=2039713 RepID=UPI002605A308|nr:hypothetical protein [Neomegalonema sp.]MDD2869767.1 hypothetical protein [Neomegalonema sp.]
MPSKPLIIPLLILVFGVLASFLDVELQTVAGWRDELWARLALLLTMTVLIERSTEVYLVATGQNGPDRYRVSQSDSEGADASQPAAIATLMLGIAVALVGVGLLDAVVEFKSDTTPGWYARTTFKGVDVVLSGGLMAGGAKLFHGLATTIQGGLLTLSHKVGPTARRTDPQKEDE